MRKVSTDSCDSVPGGTHADMCHFRTDPGKLAEFGDGARQVIAVISSQDGGYLLQVASFSLNKQTNSDNYRTV